ncbi:unnamed protein product [Prorocentrum cordatum]|uniref:Subtilisin n=1 Tax=Prorocentrum cordatum TaxID=2364126 RepID=A0ABN9S0S7_9DINO|nr:unnamed protein product [Polarella glacialis]
MVGDGAVAASERGQRPTTAPEAAHCFEPPRAGEGKDGQGWGRRGGCMRGNAICRVDQAIRGATGNAPGPNALADAACGSHWPAEEGTC